MQPTITSEVVVAYAQCPRKAYLLLCSPAQGEPHEYVRILERQQDENHARYLNRLKHKHADVAPTQQRSCVAGARCCSMPLSRLMAWQRCVTS